jgi:anti-sigma B factor antagonist
VEMIASILLVDGEPEVVAPIQAELAVAGFKSQVVDTGREALEQAQRHAFDAAIVDSRLPDGNGLDLIAAFKALRPEMACIILAPQPSCEESLRALVSGALAYIVRPLRAEAISAIIKERRQQSLSAGPKALEVRVLAYDGVPVVAPSGDLDVVTAPLLQRRLDELLTGGHQRVLLDAAALAFCDSTGLRLLVQARRRLSERSGQLALVRVPDLLRRLLELSGLQALLPCYDNEAQALGQAQSAKRRAQSGT